MIADLEPPAERDLPSIRAARMRARLRAEMRGPASARRPRTARLALAGVVTAAVAAAVATPLLLPEEQPTTVAMGPGELSPSLVVAVEDCLYGYPDRPMFEHGPRFPVTAADMAVAVEHDGRSTAVFLTREGYLACQHSAAGVLSGSEPSGGLSIQTWDGTRDWLPGPVQILQRSSEEADGGWVTAAGRISARVDRLVVDHGDGTITEARLSGGTFGVLTTTEVKPDAALAAYAVDGTEIWRQPFFRPSPSRYQCYADPSGKIVYPALGLGNSDKDSGQAVTGSEPGQAAPADRSCLPAESWKP